MAQLSIMSAGRVIQVCNVISQMDHTAENFQMLAKETKVLCVDAEAEAEAEAEVYLRSSGSV